MVIKVRLSHSRKRAPLERTARLKTLWRAGFSPRGALAPPYASEAEASRGPKLALQSVFVSFGGREAMRHSVEKPLPAVAALI
jgi:hypothetical protein